jgi:predicted transposase YbfD/YdcC
LASFFAAVPDPRAASKCRHKLLDILVIAVLGALCGAEYWTEVEFFAKAEREWLKGFLELPGGIPSHDTFGRIFALLDPKAFTEAFLTWVRSNRSEVEGDVIALDGKTSRRTFDRLAGKSPLHLVSAFSHGSGLVLGQRAVDGKSNEIKAIPELLKLIQIRGKVVTIDAMGCQKEIAREIRARKGDYVLALKGNQTRLHEDVKAFFVWAREQGFKDIPHAFSETTDKGHGRIEIRKVWCTEDISWLEGRQAWAGLKSVVAVESERITGDLSSKETRLFISSLPASDAQRMGEIVRAHWAIENRLHWVLDVMLNEDQSRVRKGNAPEVTAILRHIVLNLLRMDHQTKASIRSKRILASLKPAYRLKAILGFPEN